MTATATVADRHHHEPGVIGWIDEEGVPAALLEVRIATLRAGPTAAALPRPGTSEARQLRRWAAHVLFTELICGAAARELGLRPDAVAPLDPLAAVQLGSITGAAWQQAPAVGAVCRALFPQQRPAGPDSGARAGRASPARPEPTAYRVSHAFVAGPGLSPDGAPGPEAALRPMGWTTLDDVPTALAEALAAAAPGRLVGPVRSELGWHLARIEDMRTPDAVPPVEAADEPPAWESLRSFTVLAGPASSRVAHCRSRFRASRRPAPTGQHAPALSLLFRRVWPHRPGARFASAAAQVRGSDE